LHIPLDKLGIALRRRANSSSSRDMRHDAISWAYRHYVVQLELLLRPVGADEALVVNALSRVIG
jgi:hypothetical protein